MKELFEARVRGIDGVEYDEVLHAHVIKLHHKQMEIAKSRARFKVVVAGRRFGKTTLARHSLIESSMEADYRLTWYVAPTYRMAKDVMWHTLLQSIPVQYITKKHETSMEITLINGSIIQLKSADKPDDLRGRGVDHVVLDEYQDFKTGAFEQAIYPTLTDKGGSALIIGTPKQFNQLYELYMKGQDPELLDWKSWQIPTIASPFISKYEIEQAKKNLDQKTFEQEYEASFETMAGRVYYAFDRSVHVGDYSLNPNLPIIVGQDFNVDPMCSAIMQWYPSENKMKIVDEIYFNNSSTSEIADELERRYWRQIAAKRLIMYPDASGSHRSSARGDSDFQVFREKGIRRIVFRPKNPNVVDRVNAVNSMLRSYDNTVRLVVDHGCKQVIRSLEQTLYVQGQNRIDKTLDTDHMSDAIGYPIAYLFPVNKLVSVGVSI